MTIKRTYFNDATRTWTLGGMAEAMYQWLRDRVASKDPAAPSSYRGYQLAGTYNPDDPDPRRFDPPPSWLTPEAMMKATCAWNAGAMQEYLFKNGLIPLVRGLVGGDGEFESYCGADITMSITPILVPLEGYYYRVTLDDTDIAPFSLTPCSQLQVWPVRTNLDPVAMLTRVRRIENGWEYAVSGALGDYIQAKVHLEIRL